MGFKICMVRVDRIGDLVLTLPCEELWRRTRPDDQIEWCVAGSLKFVMDHVVPQRQVFYLQDSPKEFFKRVQAAFALARQIREKKFDEAVIFHAPWWVALAFWLAGVKRRTGVASQWFSWIFYNRRLRQKRSQATQHESQYNADLVAFALGQKTSSDLEPRTAAAGEVKKSTPLTLTKLQARRDLAEKWAAALQERGVSLKNLVVIHPGMAGSARNWPPSFYRQLAEVCVKNKMSVAVTGSKTDLDFVKVSEILSVPGVVNFTEQTDGAGLIALLSLARAVVVPSTGVAHLAASLGVRVAGIYSPVRVQAPMRWGPLGRSVKVFVPPVSSCPGTLKCLGPACSLYDCLEQIPVDLVASYVMDKS